jgi:3-oxoacyl-(acyl-carrier-protein) synthase
MAFKSNLGHTGHASFSLESVLAIKALYENRLSPIRNLEDEITIDGKSKYFDFVKEEREKELNSIMQSSFGFGGFNAAVLYKKVI